MSRGNNIDPSIYAVALGIAALLFLGSLTVALLTGRRDFADVALPLGGILLCLWLWFSVRMAGRQ